VGVVDPDVAVGLHPVELDEDAAAGQVRRQREMLSVPADAGWQESPGAPGRIQTVEGALDAPVVRHVEAAPGAVAKIGLEGAVEIAQGEFPARVERDHLADRIGGERRGEEAQSEGGASQNKAEESIHGVKE
jgi:hypothetical protein